MKDVLDRFGLTEFLAYLCPGAIGLSSILIWMSSSALKLALEVIAKNSVLATTVLTLAAMRHLIRDDSLPASAKKLLGFTDNRQDASLQAGHLNDFVMILLLRGGLLAALRNQPDGLLNDDTLAAVQRLRPLAAEAALSLAQLAVAWTLQNQDVSAAIVGATRPEQVRENVKAAGVRLDAGLMSRIDEALGDAVIRDPAQTASPASRPRL